MDKHENERVDDARVEDLDTPQADAEEVKGGGNFGVEREMKEDPAAVKGGPHVRVFGGGWDANHNETLVAL